MPECRFCNGTIKEEDAFCKICGYDSKTDRISPNFVPPTNFPLMPPNKKAASLVSRGVSPGVKKFAFIGLIIIMFSIFYKNHFNISNVLAETKHFFTMLARGKVSLGQSKQKKEIEWIDVRTFKDYKDARY